MASPGDHRRIFKLKYCVGEKLVDVAVADSTHLPAADIQTQEAWPGAVHSLNTKLLPDVARIAVGRSIVDLDVVHAHPDFIYHARVDGSRPVDNAVLDGREVEAVEVQLEGVSGGIVLETPRVAGEKAVLLGSVIVNFHVTLIVINVAGSRIEEVVSQIAVYGKGIERRSKQRFRHRVNRAQWNLVVGEWRALSVHYIERVIKLDALLLQQLRKVALAF